MIKVTEVKINLIKPIEGLMGFASIVVDNNICLTSIAIYKKLNKEGYRIVYPARKGFDIFYPINRETGNIIQDAILERLEEILTKADLNA